jgi:hypothetical protein
MPDTGQPGSRLNGSGTLATATIQRRRTSSTITLRGNYSVSITAANAPGNTPVTAAD